VKPNKFLGQNFLNSKKIIADIIKAADLQPDDVVLEVGPGKGILTEALLEVVPKGRVIAVEKDAWLVEFLRGKFPGAKNLEIIHDDILKFNFPRYALHVPRYTIVANIPYYITSHFLRKFLESDYQPSKMVLMLQKEVAERITAKDKKESILSISVKAYGKPKIIKKVLARYFSPAPKVDSAILLIDNISKKLFKEMAAEKFVSLKTGIKGNLTETKFLGPIEARFFSLIKQGFSQKRKMLKNNLKLLDIECLTKCGVAENARAENLTMENWRCLAQVF